MLLLFPFFLLSVDGLRMEHKNTTDTFKERADMGVSPSMLFPINRHPFYNNIPLLGTPSVFPHPHPLPLDLYGNTRPPLLPPSFSPTPMEYHEAFPMPGLSTIQRHPKPFTPPKQNIMNYQNTKPHYTQHGQNPQTLRKPSDLFNHHMKPVQDEGPVVVMIHSKPPGNVEATIRQVPHHRNRYRPNKNQVPNHKDISIDSISPELISDEHSVHEMDEKIRAKVTRNPMFAPKRGHQNLADRPNPIDVRIPVAIKTYNGGLPNQRNPVADKNEKNERLQYSPKSVTPHSSVGNPQNSPLSDFEPEVSYASEEEETSAYDNSKHHNRNNDETSVENSKRHYYYPTTKSEKMDFSNRDINTTPGKHISSVTEKPTIYSNQNSKWQSVPSSVYSDSAYTKSMKETGTTRGVTSSNIYETRPATTSSHLYDNNRHRIRKPTPAIRQKVPSRHLKRPTQQFIDAIKKVSTEANDPSSIIAQRGNGHFTHTENFRKTANGFNSKNSGPSSFNNKSHTGTHASVDSIQWTKGVSITENSKAVTQPTPVFFNYQTVKRNHKNRNNQKHSMGSRLVENKSRTPSDIYNSSPVFVRQTTTPSSVQDLSNNNNSYLKSIITSSTVRDVLNKGNKIFGRRNITSKNQKNDENRVYYMPGDHTLPTLFTKPTTSRPRFMLSSNSKASTKDDKSVSSFKEIDTTPQTIYLEPDESGSLSFSAFHTTKHTSPSPVYYRTEISTLPNLQPTVSSRVSPTVHYRIKTTKTPTTSSPRVQYRIRVVTSAPTTEHKPSPSSLNNSTNNNATASDKLTQASVLSYSKANYLWNRTKSRSSTNEKLKHPTSRETTKSALVSNENRTTSSTSRNKDRSKVETRRSSLDYREISKKNNQTQSETTVHEVTTEVNPEAALISSVKSMRSKVQDLVGKAMKQVMSFVVNMGSEVQMSSDCAFALLRWIRGIKALDLWAIRMLDASSKIPEGVLYGTFSSFGSYDECIEIGFNDKKAGAIRGQYCSVDIQPYLPKNDRRFTIKGAFTKYPKIRQMFKEMNVDENTVAYYYFLKHRIGVCLPSACSTSDIGNVTKRISEQVQLNITLGLCETATRDKLTKGQIITLIGIAISFVIVIISTIFDILLRIRASFKKEVETDEIISEKCTSQQVCYAFSAYRNVCQILEPTIPSGHFSAIHGIKFLSITWVMLGHVYYCKDYLILAGMNKIRDLGSNVAFQVVLNSSFAADTFFFISGLLVVYTSLLCLEKRNSGFNIVGFYLKRYFRLTPAFLMASGVILLGPLAGSGPLWTETLKPFVTGCQNYWWTNIFYFSNFVPSSESCVPHGWFVSCEMQFYAIAPIIILVLHRRPKIGIFLILIGVLTSMAVVAILTFVFDLPPFSLFSLPHPSDINDYLDTIGYKPYTHYSVYCIGMAIGYVLAAKDKLVISRVNQFFGWCFAIAGGLAVVYGTLAWNKGNLPEWPVAVAYASTCRTVWALAVAWIIVICIAGHGGIINSILSWHGFIPLSRLTYLAYLLHPILMYIYVSYVRIPFYFSHYVMVYLYFGHLFMTFGLSFIFSLVFEVPYINLEKIITEHLRRSKRKRRASFTERPGNWHHRDHPEVADPVVLMRRRSERPHC